jgi:tripartite-type tricarboxylate transporter receptor subunit TctC
MNRRHFVFSTSAALAGLTLNREAVAQGSEPPSAYPSRPIRLVVAFAPGGSTDVTARALAPKLQDLLGQRILIDNKPGAGSNVGTEFAARQPADGYTLLLGTVANAINMTLYNNLSYDLLRDFIPISIASTAPAVLVVHPSVPVKSVKELIDLAKAKPGQLNYASSGVGTTPHLAGEMLKMRFGLDITHVAYKSAAPALTDTIGGTTLMGFKTALSAIPSIQAGKLRCIAVAAANRLALMPDVPTMAEAGVPDFEITSWNGFFAPRGTHPDIIRRIATECAKIPTMADIRETFAAQASEALASSPQQFRAYCEAEIRKWGEVIRKANISVNS